MIFRRPLFFFLISQWSSPLPSVVVVDAKLLLWSSLKDDNSTSSERKTPQKKGDEGSIRDRLKLFHKHDDETSAAKTARYEYGLLSPAKYLNVVFLYLRSSIQDMTERLFSSDDKSQPSSSAYASFRQTRYEDMVFEPKDVWQGFLSAIAALKAGYLGGVHSIVDGAYELGCGTISFLSGGSDVDNPLSYSFLTDLFYGLHRGAIRAADGVYLFAAGAVVGTRNLMVGIYRTPEAVRSSKLGMMYYPRGKAPFAAPARRDDYGQVEYVAVWDYYSLDDEDGAIRTEEKKLKEQDIHYPSQHERRRERTPKIRRRRASVSVKDRKYYNVLGVATDANMREIRSAYRKEALKQHPDKQTASFPPTNDNTLSGDPHIEGFLDLTEAYRILSDDASRDAYDQHGLCFREETSLPDEGSQEDYVDLVDELFSAGAVRDYVGNILIAPIVNEMFGFAKNRDTSRESVKVQNLQQQRRTVEVAKYLRDRVNPYVGGEETAEDFTLSCRREADSILREGGEPAAAFLRAVGGTMLEEADLRIGRVLPLVRKGLSVSSQRIKSSIASARVYAPVYFRAALEGLVLGAYDGREGDDSGDCSGGRASNGEVVDQGAVLDLLWQYVVNDAVSALRGACGKVFADQGARDASLAFVRTPSLVKHRRARRAEAIRILAREMLAASNEFSVSMDER